MHNTDWDALRVVMAVADRGSAVAAGRALAMDPSTVLRRIAKFERMSGVRLFERRRTGYVPTPECAPVVEAARRMETCVLGLDRGIAGRDARLEGELTVTTTDTILHGALAEDLVAFGEAHPRIRISVSVTPARLDLARRAADVAVRASRSPPEALVGARASGMAFAVYGAPSLTASLAGGPGRGPGGREGWDRPGLPWIGIGAALAGSPIGAWMERNAPPDAVTMTADSFLAMRDCAAAGGGLTVLPCFIGDAAPGLERATGPVAEMETSMWILTHPDLRGAARVRALTSHLLRTLRARREALEGRG